MFVVEEYNCVVVGNAFKSVPDIVVVVGDMVHCDPFNIVVPFTSNVAVGPVVPIPTLPVLMLYILVPF